MTYLLFGFTLAAAWSVGLTIALSAVVAAAAGPAIALLEGRAPHVRARWLLALRILPASISRLFVLFVFLPSFFYFEPRGFDESFNLLTITATALAIAVWCAGISRAASAVREASARTARWLASATPIAIGDGSIPAFVVADDAPAMMLAGVRRPRLLVTRTFLDALTESELAVAAAHEAAHVRSRDNAKRLLMRALPDVMPWFRGTARIERAWAAAAEQMADLRAGGSLAARLDLASALVKAAKMTPVFDSAGIALSSPFAGEGIAARIECLMADAPVASSDSTWSIPARVFLWIAVACLLAVLVLKIDPLLAAVHALSEFLVQRFV